MRIERFNAVFCFLNIGGIAANNLSCTSGRNYWASALFRPWPQFVDPVNRFNGGAWALAGWTGWGSLGGNIGSDASCASARRRPLHLWNSMEPQTEPCGSRIQQHIVGANGQPGQTAIGSLSCSAPALGKAICTVVNFNNKSFSVVGP